MVLRGVTTKRQVSDTPGNPPVQEQSSYNKETRFIRTGTEGTTSLNLGPRTGLGPVRPRVQGHRPRLTRCARRNDEGFV